MMLRKEEVDVSMLSNTKVFHFGTFSMTDADNTAATEYALSIARSNDVLITFDP